MNPTYSVPSIYGKVKKTDTPLTVTVPGSKSITNRALLLATLADGTSTLRGALFSDDSRHFLKCVQDLGFETCVDEANKVITVTGLGGAIPNKEATLDVGSAGTAARFLTAYLGVSEGTYHMNSSDQMKKRPMAPLMDSLKKLGCEFTCTENDGHFPFIIRSHSFGSDSITVNIDSSSQFLSALLISSVLSSKDFTTTLEGSHGMAYIKITTDMMKQFGVTATPLYYCNGNNDNHDCSSCVNSKKPYAYKIAAGQKYSALDYAIEPDVSGASYFYAFGALLNIPVQVAGVHFDSLQGDIAFLRILETMGCKLNDTANGILLTPPADGKLKAVTADMSACSDQAITLAAIAPYAEGPVTITGISHIRFQECDRMSAIVTELSKMGIRCESTEDSITIYPGQPTPTLVETYDDHRVAMGFALTGLRAEGIVISDPACCRKTFENYFETLDDCIRRIT